MLTKNLALVGLLLIAGAPVAAADGGAGPGADVSAHADQNMIACQTFLDGTSVGTGPAFRPSVEVQYEDCGDVSADADTQQLAVIACITFLDGTSVGTGPALQPSASVQYEDCGNVIATASA